MALSVVELARNVPPTATMYGELKGLPVQDPIQARSYTVSEPLISELRLLRAR
jgi:hypothetical protein